MPIISTPNNPNNAPSIETARESVRLGSNTPWYKNKNDGEGSSFISVTDTSWGRGLLAHERRREQNEKSDDTFRSKPSEWTKIVFLLDFVSV